MTENHGVAGSIPALGTTSYAKSSAPLCSIADLVIVAALIIFVLVAISTGFDMINGG